MARGDAVINTDVDPFAARTFRWRTLLRIGVPVLGVALTIALILAIAIYIDQANRRGALALSEDVLTALDARISEQVGSYFGPAERALAIGKYLAGGEPMSQRRELVEKFSIGALKEISQIAEFIFADQEGNFMMVRRSESGGIDTKLIHNVPDQRKVLWIRRNSRDEEIAREEDPSDTYDPRTRSWYERALISDTMFWTDAYVFYTAGEPGVTASLRYTGVDGRVFVFGVDITLAALSRFLGSLEIGQTGRAMIIDGNGRIIAHPQIRRVVRRGSNSEAEEVMTAQIDEIGDDVAAAAYDWFRIEGPGHRTVTVGDRRYLATYTPLKSAGRNWSILIVVPEDDFISFVARNSRIGLGMSLFIVVLSALGAILLVKQGLRADRITRLMLERSHLMARQSAAFDHLADETDLLDSPDNPPKALTEIATDLTGATRASLWYFLDDGQALRCADRFDSVNSHHVVGMELQRGELPQFFDLLITGAAVEIADAASDPRTADLYRLMLAPFACRSLSMVPVHRHGQVVGTIWLEDPVDTVNSRNFLRILATTAGLRGGDMWTSTPHGGEQHRAAAPEPDEVRSFSAELTSRSLDAATSGNGVYPELSVFVLRIADSAATVSGSAEPTPELVDAITVVMQELAAEQEIPYLKIIGGDIIGAAGFAGDDPSAVARIANIAIAGRDRLAALFEANGLAPEFRLGIDSGLAIGRSIGGTPRLFNLWGEAVRTAHTMASTAFPGSIQTSEYVYVRLRHSFLFRPRGTFYLPVRGSMQTFILAGRM